MMGLFDIFKKNKDGEGKKPNAAAKYAEAAGSKRAQPYDRQEAIQELGKLGTAEAAEALLRRFSFSTDPSITDQEEKELAFDGILKAGREALEPVRAFVAKAESINWGLRVARELLEEEELVDELLVWLSKWDTEYSKFNEPKLQILEALGEIKNPKIREAVEPFLEDASDPGRFNAVVAVLMQDDVAGLQPLLKLLLDEESQRIRAKIANGILAQGWEIPDEQRDAVRKVLPPEFSVDGAGHIKKR